MVSLTLNVTMLPQFSIFHLHRIQHDILLFIRDIRLCGLPPPSCVAWG